MPQDNPNEVKVKKKVKKFIVPKRGLTYTLYLEESVKSTWQMRVLGTCAIYS